MLRFFQTPLFHSIVAALGSFSFGYHLAIFSGICLLVKESFSLTVFEQQCFASMILIGAIVGSICGGWLVDRIGSRKGLFVAATILIFGSYWTAEAPTCAHLFWGRVSIGLSLGLLGVAVPSYIVAIAPTASRGAYVSINQLSIVIGVLSANVISYLYAASSAWRSMLFFPLWPALLFFALLFFIPESAKGERQAKKSFTALLKPPYTKPFWIAVWLGVIQQASGINILLYYAPHIFQQVGYESIESAVFVTMLLGVINLVMTVAALFLLDRWGRKPLLLAGIAGMGLSFVALALCLSGVFPCVKEIPAASTLLCVASFAIGIGPVYWIVVSEIFPSEVRGQALGVSTLITWVMNIAVVSTFLSLLDWLGAGLAFGLYAAILALAFLYVWKQIPETKGKTINEIQAIWR